MIKNFKIKISFLFLAISFFSLLAVEQAQAAAYLADDLLGQLDGTFAPVYTTSIPDNNRGNGARGFNLPEYATVDTTNHKLYVSDTNNNRVLIFHLDNSDALIDRVADNILGYDNFKGQVDVSNGPDHFNSPRDLVYDVTNSRLFVADAGNHRVVVFNLSTITNGENAVNVLGQAGFGLGSANQGGTVNINTLNSPRGLAYDSGAQRLFVSDSSNHRIVVYDVTAITNGENAVSVLGQMDFVSNAVNMGGVTLPNTFSAPHDVVYHADTNRLFVADRDNNRVTVYDVTTIVNGEAPANVLGQPDFISSSAAITQAGMGNPEGLVYGSATTNQLFVSDSSNNRILVFDVAAITNGEPAANVLGQAGFVTNSSATTQAGLNHPKGLAFSVTGNLLYAVEVDNNRVCVYDVAAISNNENKVNCLGQLDPSDNPVYTNNIVNNGAVNQLTSIGFNEPKNIALDSANRRLFVADATNNRVLVFNLDASLNLVDRLADNVLGQANFTSRAAVTTQSGMSSPNGLTYDSVLNRLFVGDTQNHRVLVFDVRSSGSASTDLCSNGTSTTGMANGMNASCVLGQANFTSAGFGATQSVLNGPLQLVFQSSNNRLFALDHFNSRVLVFDVASITNGENAVNVLGQANFTNSASATTQSGYDNPEGIALDTTNNRLFVSDSDNNRVLVFDVRSSGSTSTTLCGTSTTGIANGMNASCVLGQANFTTATSATTQSGLNEPKGVAWESTYLYVADAHNNRVVMFDITNYGNGMNALNVLGPNNFTTATAGTSQSTLNFPYGLELDVTNHRLYVSERNNARVIIYNLIRITNTTFSNGTAGSSYSQTVTTTGNKGTLTFNVSAGSLSPGLSLAAGTGVISGSPTTTGNSAFTILATDTGDAGTFVDDQAYTLTIGGGSSIARQPTLSPMISLQVSLGEHRDQACLRNINQLLAGIRMVPGRVSLAADLVRLAGRLAFDTLAQIRSNVLLHAQLRELTREPYLAPLLRCQSSEGLVLEVWGVGNRTTPVASVNVSTDFFGQATVQLPSLPIKSYDFTIRKSFGLRQTLANISLVDSLALHFPEPIRVGDLDGDGRINATDFTQFMMNLGTLQYDFNEDGVISLYDVVDFLRGTR